MGYFSNENKKKKRAKYSCSYEAYWYSKGAYGKERIERHKKRLDARRLKRKERNRRCPCCGRYKDPDDWW